MRTRALTYGAMTWACFILAATAPRAAELALGEPYARDGLIAVPLLLVPGAGESVASLQVDIVTAAGYAVLDVTAAPAATGAGKDVVYAGGPGRATVIVAGFNRHSMGEGPIATVYLAPAGDGAAPPELALARGVISDPRGNALPVELRLGRKAVDEPADNGRPGAETSGEDGTAPPAQTGNAERRGEGRESGGAGWTAYAGPDDAGSPGMGRHTAGASRARGGLLRMPDASGPVPGAPGRASSRGRASQSVNNGSRPEGWMMRPQPPLLIRRLEYPPDPAAAAPGCGARPDASENPDTPARVAALGARDSRGPRADGAHEAGRGDAHSARWSLPGVRRWPAILILAGCLAVALTARHRLFRKG